MATTKKVASARSLKKRAVPKKSAVLSRSKTPTGKKEASKVKKRPTVIKKKSVKLSVKKDVAKAIAKSATKKTKLTIKDKTVSNSAKDTKTNKAVSTKTQSKPKQNTLMKRRNLFPSVAKVPLSLALFSAVKLPMNLDVFAIQTARIGGLMIVAMGAFFTLLYSQYIWNAPIIANSISGSQMIGAVCVLEGSKFTEYEQCIENNILFEQSQSSSFSSSSDSQSGASSQDQVVTEPPMTFDVDGVEPLSDTVSILVHVDDAISVKVLVFKESYTEPLYLGYATHLGGSVWEYKWNTENYPDTSYKVAADVVNNNAPNDIYRDSDAKYLEVSNAPVAEVATSTPPAEVDEKPEAILSLLSPTPVEGEALFKVKVKEAEEVILFAHHKESGSDNRLGSAIFDAGEYWKYQWDSTAYTDGEYVITSRIKNQYGTYHDGKQVVVVQNVVADETKASSSSVDSVIVNGDEKVEEEPALEPPEVTFEVQNSGTLSGIAGMRIEIDEAKFVEIWAVPVGSKTEQIIGLATRTYNGSDRWMYQWNTRNIPNGEYTLFARVKNSFGIYRSNVVRATVYNKPVVEPMTVEQEEETEKIAVAQEVEKEVFKNEEVIKEEPEEEEKVSDSDATADNSSQEIEDEREVDKILEEFSETIDDELKRLISAYRSKDDEAIATAEQRIERLKREIADSVVGPTRTERVLERIDARVNKIVAEYKVLAVKVEALIVERVGADVFKDSDSDGLSDYDERTLYNTDPYSADSDGDGFIDGAEVAQGYDPLDVKREVAVAYESPKEKGVVREDILTVDSIVAVIPDEPSEDLDGVDEGAVISGTALPNSYVTLYIFSTPIVVTVKTQADGSWEYRFDKELEDGEHNIYVGVTDNAGRIVAKSNPFTFVKEAQAFTQVDALAIASTGNNQDDDSLMSTYMIYLILSISVVSIGLVLILLGLHLDTRQRRYKTVINTEEES